MSNLSETMLINVGTDDGVYANMPVISEEGIVGHTISATKSTAKVQPIIDPASSISGTMHISRDNLMVKGMLNERNKLKAVYIGAEADLVLNDIVETSGLGRNISKRFENRGTKGNCRIRKCNRKICNS